MKRILILSGLQGSGKTSNANEVAKTLVDIGYRVHRFKFADIIYQMHNACLPILKNANVISNSVEKEGTLLQILGSEYGRETLGKDVWVKALRFRCDEALKCDHEALIIIDDMRFENEMDAFPDAYHVRLTCPRNVRYIRCDAWRDDENHQSETGLNEYEKAKKFQLYIDTQENPVSVNALEIRRAWMNDE